uniref:Retrovirus-related Pol polyprotein from transposon RE1 n=1 Tax=Vitis vinifera TaxID=29760 RepID=A5CBT8_VITVI|nr:hypothetical protein VITISV_015907 [Vitis vinifera]
MEEAKTMKTPMSSSIKLDKDEKGKSVNSTMYRDMIGSLLYLIASKPDIMYSVCLCATFQSCPKESHLSAVKRILRYLKGTMDIGLWYPKGDNFELIGFSDADFAGCKVVRKSTSDTCHFLGHSLVSWHSKKQNSVALSMAEVEYIAADLCCAQILWMKQTLSDFNLFFEHVPIKCDNTSTINISKNPVQHSRTKHIEIRHHFLRDHVQKGDITLEFVSTKDQFANIFTKPLSEEQFVDIRKQLGGKGEGGKHETRKCKKIGPLTDDQAVDRFVGAGNLKRPPALHFSPVFLHTLKTLHILASRRERQPPPRLRASALLSHLSLSRRRLTEGRVAMISEPIFQTLARAFYSWVTYGLGGPVMSTVRGVEIRLSPESICHILDIPSVGLRVYEAKMHPGAEEETEIKEMEDGLDPQRDFEQRGPELDIPPPPQSEGIHVEATFSEPMMTDPSYIAGPSSQPSFTKLPHTEIPSQAPHAPDHAPWMDVSAQISSLGTRIEERIVQY